MNALLKKLWNRLMKFFDHKNHGDSHFAIFLVSSNFLFQKKMFDRFGGLFKKWVSVSLEIIFSRTEGTPLHICPFLFLWWIFNYDWRELHSAVHYQKAMIGGNIGVMSTPYSKYRMTSFRSRKNKFKTIPNWTFLTFRFVWRFWTFLDNLDISGQSC